MILHYVYETFFSTQPLVPSTYFFSNPNQFHNHTLLLALDLTESYKLHSLVQTSLLILLSSNDHDTNQDDIEEPLFYKLFLCHPLLHFLDSNIVPCRNFHHHHHHQPHELEHFLCLWLCMKKKTSY
ncbi:chaperone protein dnaJ 20, chloroplastic [Trifolium repens]|nr:chaperone protein dnaJ 20, chloroplastic [Trifolium repens]